MAFIGNAPASVATNFQGVVSDSFNGTGSQTDFTLTRSVASVAWIEVLVDNVQQSPYDGSYSVTGTTLSFSGAPPSGTNNVYVVYRDQPLASIIDSTAYRQTEVDTLLDAKVSKAGDTMTGNLIVDANVGIGASSPDGKLDIESSTSNHLFLTRTGVGAYSFGVGASNALQIRNDGTERMRIDSAGRVTTPYQPMFECSPSSNIGLSTTADTKMVFNTLFENIGSHYSTSTGRFTAPVAGTYYFYVAGSMVTAGTDNYVSTHFRKNGTDWSMYGRSGSYGAQYVSAVSIKVGYLLANDYVELWAYCNASGTYLHSTECRFGGFLIG